jgi:2-desacetyl-2-hydroxyethyl bacteriochlorophyllide A dehydrogenase
MDRYALVFTKPYQVQIQRETLSTPDENQVLVKTLVSSISAGTEILLYRNQLKKGALLDIKIPYLSHGFTYPTKYGYSSVGRIISLGKNVPPQWQDKLVFSFHPHESHFLASPPDLIPLPSGMPLEDAVFLSNMETAVNFVMDGNPVEGENVVVFGQGVVGLLLTALLAKKPCLQRITIDHYPLRRTMSMRLGADVSLDTHENIQKFLGNKKSDNGTGADLCFEVSGQPAALDKAIQCTGFGGRIIIGSWYGTKKVLLDLGEHFHRNRIHIQSSQVSTIDPRFSADWTKERRINVAFEMIQKIKPARLVTHTYPFHQAAEAYDLLDTHPEKTIQVLLKYEEENRNV